jgi:UDPglucose 6-dehydrogenase
MSRIGVVGAGYVGLTTAVCFAHLGHDVVCCDIDETKVKRLNDGEVPIVEAGVDTLLAEGLRSGRLRFELGTPAAAEGAEFVYLCVPTPQGLDGRADLSYIEAAARAIAPVLESGAVVVNKSTVPVGSTKVVERVLQRPDVSVVSNPEFLREGSAVHDFLHPDRIVVGADDQAAAIRVASLYLGVPAPLIVTDPASAETIKYAANAFLATKISFVNAVAAVCEAVGADVNDVVLGIGYDKRIGQEFLKPGPGWGGSCFVGGETVLARRGEHISLLAFADLFEQIERTGLHGWEVLAWRPGEPRPLFLPLSAATRRWYEGDVIDVATKMGRRVTVTADHPFVTADGAWETPNEVVEAGRLTDRHWLPVAAEAPFLADPAPRFADVSEAVGAAGLTREQIIVRLSGEHRRLARERDLALPGPRRWNARRSGTLRLSELDLLGLTLEGGQLGTASNGTYVPAVMELDADFWHVLGLYLAEGWATKDGDRHRVSWSFHPDGEPELVAAVRSFWERHGVKATEHRASTTTKVMVSSRLLAAWFVDVLGLGTNAYTKRLPDLVWRVGDEHKRAVLRGLWDGDGSWSYVNGGPSVVLEYGTVSRGLADGMVRLLADLGVVARVKVGRTAKSTVDTYWLTISGADAVEHALFLLPPSEADVVRRSLDAQAKRIRPTGYRWFSKGTAWVRVVSAERRPFAGPVYSVEVPGAHTVVTSFGLVAHNCFPKDTYALVRIAEDAGYDFGLLKGVIEVNDEQRSRVVDKVREAVGGSVAAKTVAVWGLTFKARTDDLRDSPSLAICEQLVRQGAVVRAYDPTVTADLPGITVCPDAYTACEGADVVAVLTEWDEFRWLDPDVVASKVAGRQVVDGRNLLDRQAYLRAGFGYAGIGR